MYIDATHLLPVISFSEYLIAA